jgi:hypothetical protein
LIYIRFRLKEKTSECYCNISTSCKLEKPICCNEFMALAYKR